MVAFYTTKERALQEQDAFQPGMWLYAESPNPDELEALATTYGLNEDLLRDALDPHEIPRFEIDEEAVYLFTRIPTSFENNQESTRPVLVVLTEGFVATITSGALPQALLAPRYGGVPSPAEKEAFTLFLLSRISSLYARSLSGIAKQIRKLRIHPEKVRGRDILGFVEQESILNDYLSSLNPLTLLYTRLKNTLSDEYTDEVEDIQLANEQLLKTCVSNLKTIGNLREAYSAITTNNLNRVIKLFTALTIVLTIPTLIASIFGMNVPLPFVDHPYGFVLIVGGTFLITLIVLIFFYARKWL